MVLRCPDFASLHFPAHLCCGVLYTYRPTDLLLRPITSSPPSSSSHHPSYYPPPPNQLLLSHSLLTTTVPPPWASLHSYATPNPPSGIVPTINQSINQTTTYDPNSERTFPPLSIDALRHDKQLWNHDSGGFDTYMTERGSLARGGGGG